MTDQEKPKLTHEERMARKRLWLIRKLLKRLKNAAF